MRIARASRVLAVVLIGPIVAALIAPSPAAAAPGEPPIPIPNPDLPLGCGIDILVILDESGSIGSAGATDDVKEAFRAFTRALRNTGSRMAVAEFSTVARLPLVPPFRDQYVTVTNTTISQVFDPYINGFDPDGLTHWEDGFRVGRYFLPPPDPLRPHLTVFITDGDPNKITRETGSNRVTYDPGNPVVADNEYELQVPLRENQQTQAVNNPAKNRAVPNANALKAPKSHILAVAVGNGLSSQASLNRIIDVSGPDVFTGTGSFDITTDDVYRVPDFDDLEEALREAAFQLCAPSVTVHKLIDVTPDPDTDDASPGAGWGMTAIASPTPVDWVLPDSGAGDTATAATDGSGFVTFQWQTATPADSFVSITEEDPGGVPPGFVNDQSATRCIYRTPDTAGDLPLTITITDGGFSGTVPDDAIVTCEMVNRVPPAPSIDLEKDTNGVDADDPAEAPFIPVGEPITWTYLVTNTGNVTLSDIAVVDDQGVAVTCPETTLAPGEDVVCTATGTAAAGPYANIGTVTGTPSTGGQVSDSDPSHYIGTAPGIAIEKTTNGEDADDAPGPFVPVGDPVVWAYTVSNTGNTALTGVAVTDSEGVVVTCPQTTLAVGESMPCTARPGVAVAGQYENVGSVTGISPTGPVQDSDPSHYFGSAPAVEIVKTTNGEDASTPAEAVNVQPGERVSWLYEITNTGNVPLLWTVTDDQLGVVACPRLLFIAPGRSIFCFASGIAEVGPYANIGTVVGTGPAGQVVTDSDPSHYFGVLGNIDIEKFTNDFNAEQPPGPFLPPGSPVTWTYRVTNTGNSPLTDVIVEDLNGVAVDCFGQDTLAVGASFDCEATGTAEPDQYTNISTATGTPPVGPDVRDEDPSHYFGAVPGINLQKYTQGDDADLAPGPLIPVGDPVEWTYVVTNSGNLTVDDIVVIDDQGVAVDCPSTSLAPAESMDCTATGTSVEGQYANVGTVTGTAIDGEEVTDDDPSHYFGVVSAIDIVKLANGQDANVPPGVTVPAGSNVTMTFIVTNPGNIPIKSVMVTDDQGLAVTFLGGDTNGDNDLDPDETWTFEAIAGPAAGTNLNNIGTVSGLDILENPLTASDPANVNTAAIPKTGTEAVPLTVLALALIVSGSGLLRGRRLERGK
ncbi:MAG: DUF7507 domain-containing protein [Acidimicrobiales bacterium]